MTDCNRFFSKWDYLFSEENDEKRALRKLQLYLHPDKHPGESDRYTQEFSQLGNCTAEIGNYIRSRPPSPVNSPPVRSDRSRSPIRGRAVSPLRTRSPIRRVIPRAVYEEFDRNLAQWEEQKQAERIRQRRLDKARLEEEERMERYQEEMKRREHEARGRRLAEQLEVERRKLAEQRRREDEEEILYRQSRKFKEEEDEEKDRKRRVIEERMRERERIYKPRAQQEREEDSEEERRRKRLIVEAMERQVRKNALHKDQSWCGRFCAFGKKYEYEGARK